MILLVMLCASVWIICGAVIWKILNDCKLRRRRMERLKEFEHGRSSTTGTDASR